MHADVEIPAIQNGAGIQFSSYEVYDDDKIYHRVMYNLNDESAFNSWTPEFHDLDQWVQIGAAELKKWMKIIIQGKHSLDQWVSKLYIESSLDGKTFTQEGSEHTGNTDQSTQVTIEIDGSTGVIGRAIRVCPSEWNVKISMRIEAYYKELSSSEIAAIDMSIEVAAIDSGAIVQTSSYYYSGLDTMGYNVG